MKKIAIAGILGATVLVAAMLGIAALAPAKADKIDVCHFDPEANDGAGEYVLISVGSESARDHHLANHVYDNGADFVPSDTMPCPPA